MNRSPSCNRSTVDLLSILRGRPQAAASIAGSKNYPGISGSVRLYQTNAGVIVLAQVGGLPQSGLPCRERVFGFHIHEGTDCGGNIDDPLADAMSHYNPNGCGHPHHAGDLPPLFGNSGLALSLFLTDRFSTENDVWGVIINHTKIEEVMGGAFRSWESSAGKVRRCVGASSGDVESLSITFLAQAI